MNKNANRQIAFRARDAHRRRRGLMTVDMGGGGGRVGSREQVLPRPSKCELLRPHMAAEGN